MVKSEITTSNIKTKEQHFQDTLRANQLKVTQPRLRVLEAFDVHESAISQPELEKLIGNDIDRVTLYRILASFQEKGILHKIFDLNGTATYAICSTQCTQHHHNDQHVHFICSDCNSVYCLEEVTIPEFKVPSGFSLKEVVINAVGICDKCKA